MYFDEKSVPQPPALASMLLLLQMFNPVTNCYSVTGVRVVTVVTGGLCLR